MYDLQPASKRARYAGLGLAENLGASRAAEDGVKFQHTEYPEGKPGIRRSLAEMARLMREARTDKDVCGYAGDVLKAAGIDGRNRSQWTAKNVAQALLDNVRAVTIYTPDPNGAEMIVSPAGMLCLRPGLCIRRGDCDDQSVLLGAMLMCVGFNVVIVKQSWGPGHQEHVLIAVEDENGAWLKCDPSHATLLAGQAVPAVSEERLNPMDEVGSIGTAGAELVTLGAAPDTFRAVHDGALWEWRNDIGRWHMLGMVRSGLGAGLGIVSTDEVDQLIAEEGADIQSLQQAVSACTALPPNVVTEFQGFVAGWNDAVGAWQFRENSAKQDPTGVAEAVLLTYTGSTLSQLNGFKTQSQNKWWPLVKSACPSTVIPPGPVVPVPIPGSGGGGGGGAPSGNIFDEIAGVGKVVGYTAGGLVLAYGVYKIIQVAGSFAQAKAAR